jgi:hypothetical protein
MGFSPPFMSSFPTLVGSSPPYVEFAGSHSDLRLFEASGFLMWLVSSLWQMVWRFHPTRVLPLERFKSESLMFFPHCLRLDLLKHLIIVCPCARITCALIPWFKQLKHPIICSVEDCFFGFPACHLLIWTTLVANVHIVQLDVCKSFTLDHYVTFSVVFLVVFVALVVFWAFCVVSLFVLYFLTWC